MKQKNNLQKKKIKVDKGEIMEFEEACSEMYYILEHMNPDDRNKIPESTIHFFRDNRSMFYKVDFDVTKELSEQDLKDETKAFIQIINEKYFLKKSNLEGMYQDLEENTEEIKEKIEDNQESKSLTVIKKENKILAWIKNMFKKLFSNKRGEI